MTTIKRLPSARIEYYVGVMEDWTNRLQLPMWMNQLKESQQKQLAITSQC